MYNEYAERSNHEENCIIRNLIICFLILGWSNQGGRGMQHTYERREVRTEFKQKAGRKETASRYYIGG